MVILKEVCVPGHPFKVGVTVINPIIGEVEVGGACQEVILLLPLSAKPIPVFELDHVKLALPGLLEKGGTLTLAPGQTKISVTGITSGVAYMVTLNVNGIPVHPLRVGVTVIVPVTSAVDVGGASHDVILPVLLSPKPMAVFEFNQLNEAPVGSLVKGGILMVLPVQTNTSATVFTTGVG